MGRYGKQKGEAVIEDKFAVNAYITFLLWGIPAALGSALSTFADAALVGNYIGSGGLAAVNIATPVFLFYAFLGTTMAVGANVLIGNKIGQSDTDTAQKLFHALLISGLAISAVCVAAGVVFREKILIFLGAGGDTVNLAEGYAAVVFWCGGLFLFYHILSYSVRSDGAPKTAACASGVLIFLNISLDLIFLGVLKTGIAGASLSLCIATFCADVILLWHFAKKSAILHLGLSMPGRIVIRDFVKNGFGVGSAYLFQAVIMGVFNKLLAQSGALGTFYIAFFGILYTMSTFAYTFFDGASAALTPVLSIFAGEKDADSIEKVFRLAIKTALVSGLSVLAVYSIFAPDIIGFFGITDAARKEYAAGAFRIYAVSIVFSGCNVIVTSFWQNISRPKLSGLMSGLRNCLVLLAAGILLIPAWQIFGLALSYLCCEVFCLALAFYVRIADGSFPKLRKEYAEINRTYKKVYAVSTGSITELSSDLEELGKAWELDRKRMLFINLILEEIILNIVKFALTDEKEHYIAVKLIDDRGTYIMCIRDDVAGYNPFETKGDAVDRAVIGMIKKKAKHYDYQRKLVFNYLYLVL